MRDEKFLVRSLFFSSRTSENARTSDLENERQNLSLIQKNRRRRRQKFCSKNKFRSIKNSKKQQTNFTEQRKQRKNYKKKKSVGKELDTSLCCADLY